MRAGGELVITDTSPLQYLFTIKLLPILPLMFGRVIAPSAVRTELLAGLALGMPVPDPNEYTWLEVVAPTVALPELPRSVGLGEREAIGLALQNPDSLLLVDDLPGRLAATKLGIRITGTLGILLLAKAEGLISEVSGPLAALEEAGFRMSDDLISETLNLAGEG